MRYHPDTCPTCGGYLEFNSFDMENGAALQSWSCAACGSEGHDWYEPASRVVTFSNGGATCQTIDPVDTDVPYAESEEQS